MGRFESKFPRKDYEKGEACYRHRDTKKITWVRTAYQLTPDLEYLKYLECLKYLLPPGWNDAKAENGEMFYYKPEEMGWKPYSGSNKRLKGTFVPPPPTPGLRKPSPPGSNEPGYPASS